MSAAITNLLITNDDTIRADGRCVVITDVNGNTWSLACMDATTAHRLEACFRAVREDMAARKAERLDVLARVEAAA